MAALNLLPPVPQDLKSISPFLQRADELAAKDPVVAYWCAYHAAQLGIALKPKLHSSREFLATLLGILENMKKDIGPNDAIEDESASSAYIENFALKVFAMADNEDRRGNATRGTAKKFLAAANFLELLRIFDKEKADSADSSYEEKIRYAKWKAADIGKAIREGRKPTPGPAGSTPPESDIPTEPSSSVTTSTPSPPAITRAMAPPPNIVDLPSPQQDGFFPQFASFSSANGGLDAQSPGNWSTAATPGTPGLFSGNTRRAYVSEELEGRPDADDLSEGASPANSTSTWVHPGEDQAASTQVRFSPSAAGADTLFPHVRCEQDPFAAHAVIPSSSPQPPLISLSSPSSPPESGIPSAFVPEPGAPPLNAFPASSVFASSPPVSPPISPDRAYQTLPPPPPQPTAPTYIYPAPPQFSPTMPVSPPVQCAPPSVAVRVTETPVELNPVLIGRAQKHCKFAISALDYEDVEQARKDLREALRILGE